MRQPPHILFLMADQLRKDSLGCYGNEVIQAPNMEALREQASWRTTVVIFTADHDENLGDHRPAHPIYGGECGSAAAPGGAVVMA